MSTQTSLSLELVQRQLEELFIAAPAVAAGGSRLRREDLQKAAELVPLLEEVSRAASESGASPGLLVDAASGKAPVGLLAAELVLGRRRRPWRVVVIERDPGRAEACRQAAGRRKHSSLPVEIRCGELADPAQWPGGADLVVALHACGAASDAVVDRTIASRARRLLLLPCCYGAAPGRRTGSSQLPGQALAEALGPRLGLPRQASVARRFAQVIIEAERTLRLETSGYYTEVVELFSPQVSPCNLLYRARLVAEPERMRRAAAELARLQAAARASSPA